MINTNLHYQRFASRHCRHDSWQLQCTVHLLCYFTAISSIFSLLPFL